MKILLLILIILLYFLIKNTFLKEYYINENNKYAICFLAVNLTEELYNFILYLKSQDIDNNYDFYLCVDKQVYKEDYEKFHKINIISIPNNIAEEKGFKGSVLYFPESACSRDKALYYFSRENKNYNNVWFIEEDVFFYDLHSIKDLDNQYDNSIDLLSKTHTIKFRQNPLDWWWSKVINKVKLPWARSMICIVRVSKKLLEEIDKYASENKNLFIDEALFNTLALQKNLNIKNPIEFSTIYENEWAKRIFYNWNEKYMNEQTLNTSYFLHPVKNLKTQQDYRKQISLNITQ